MANAVKTYRNRDNGEIGVYPESLADVFPFLEEVAPDAKPLAYVPIPAEALAALRQAHEANVAADQLDADVDPADPSELESDPTPSQEDK
jgi:hypothetical protein